MYEVDTRTAHKTRINIKDQTLTDGRTRRKPSWSKFSKLTIIVESSNFGLRLISTIITIHFCLLVTKIRITKWALIRMVSHLDHFISRNWNQLHTQGLGYMELKKFQDN